MMQPGDICFDPVKGATRKPSLSVPPPPRPSPRSTSRFLGADAGTATRVEVEREHIELALAAENGRVQAAARRLGISRSTLYSKLKLYAIQLRRPAPVRAHSSIAAALTRQSEAPPSSA
jgi:transcriptional regulator with GAF, ATPase, and Fis domain